MTNSFSQKGIDFFILLYYIMMEGYRTKKYNHQYDFWLTLGIRSVSTTPIQI